MSEKDYEKKGAVRDIVYVVFRRKWVIVAVIVASVIPAVIHSLRIPTVYMASCKLLIKPGRENIYVAPVGDPAGQSPPLIVQNVSQLIASEIEILKSRDVIRAAVEDFQVANLFPGNSPDGPTAAHAARRPSVKAAVLQARGNLSASRLGRTDIINVGFRSHDPDIAAKFVNTVVEHYLERHLEVHRTARAYDFFKAQSNQLEQDLKTSARKLAEFKKKYNIVNFDTLKARAVGKRADLAAALGDNEAAVELVQKKISVIKANLAEVSQTRYTSQSENPEGGLIGQLKGKLYQLEMQKFYLQQRYKPDFVLAKLESVDKEIVKVKEALAAEQEEFHGSINTGLNAVYEKLAGELMAEEAKLKYLGVARESIEKQMIEYGQEVDRLSRLDPELRSLERAVRLNELNFQLYITKFEESRVSDAMDAAKMVSVTILESAMPPSAPLPKNGKMKILLSLCIAGVAGFALALLLEYLDQTFKVPEDIETKLDVPLLATIDDLPSKEVLDLEAIAVSPAPPLYYQILKTNVGMLAKEKGMKLLSVCSLAHGEGCSTVALNLAAWLAKESDSRLVLVDANLRNPSVHSTCKLPASPGLSEVIHEGAGIHEAIQGSVIPNLSVVTSGVSPPNPLVVFESPKLNELVQALKSQFDWVLFDCAPADMYPDSILLARELDGAVMVIRAENKDAATAIRAKEQLEKAGTKVVGAVLNRRRLIIPERIYKRL